MTRPPFSAALVIALLIWAGACIGANMIAAPAKFQVLDLARPVALQVGRVQFQWVGYLEYTLAMTAILTAFMASPRTQILVGVAIVAFIIQRAIILPQLSVRTDQVISGVQTDASHLHIYFIVCEFAKIIAIIASAFTALTAKPLRTESI